MKLDAKFKGDVYKVKDNSFVQPDEWLVFLAKDNAFAAVLPLYREECVRRGCDAEQIAAVDRAIERVREWRESHPERLKNPDAAGERLLDLEQRA